MGQLHKLHFKELSVNAIIDRDYKEKLEES